MPFTLGSQHCVQRGLYGIYGMTKASTISVLSGDAATFTTVALLVARYVPVQKQMALYASDLRVPSFVKAQDGTFGRAFAVSEVQGQRPRVSKWSEVHFAVILLVAVSVVGGGSVIISKLLMFTSWNLPSSRYQLSSLFVGFVIS